MEEPLICKIFKWTKAINKIIKGIRKCKEKKRLSVALLTEKPPQIQLVSLLPINGIEDKILVITVAPQKDICPHGRTYPKKAEAIVNKRIKLPLIHKAFLLKDLFNKDLKIWIYKKIKIIEETCPWIIWRIIPLKITLDIKI